MTASYTPSAGVRQPPLDVACRNLPKQRFVVRVWTTRGPPASHVAPAGNRSRRLRGNTVAGRPALARHNAVGAINRIAAHQIFEGDLSANDVATRALVRHQILDPLAILLMYPR